ncbi:hypothetical protein [Marinomonas posidonica]|uniref:Uncharacterized protein n=1 Tax=Marinomonas posidonica (strain CECT 7376 / NCIMB 14433 / IVIA-Po-181) TaxID=491952 RepID=F6CWN5_MARPP|nr:hypothetical protein [Marinomonas posidonica]AEF54385.1 hypothetical protein Mar181_1342 [Marinomonas posidonica IVIA-Po-181]
MYIRFETTLCFQGTQHHKGIFAAMGDLKRMKKMSEAEEAWYVEAANWFNTNLPNPSCFDSSISEEIKFKAKSWFVLAPSDFIKNAREVVAILQKYGIVVNELRTEVPGIILYKDVFQVVALPSDKKV